MRWTGAASSIHALGAAIYAISMCRGWTMSGDPVRAVAATNTALRSAHSVGNGLVVISSMLAVRTVQDFGIKVKKASHIGAH